MINGRAEFIAIVGPMFSGKSEALMARLRSARRSHRNVLIVKPKKDTRTTNKIASRRMKEEEKRFEEFTSMLAQPVEGADELLSLVEATRCQVLGVDETQFFEPWLTEVLQKLYNGGRGIDILVAGLDLDAWQRPFGIMPQLLAIADEVHKFTADCFICGQKARFTQKLKGSSSQIEVGDADKYEARCNNCWTPPPVDKEKS